MSAETSSVRYDSPLPGPAVPSGQNRYAIAAWIFLRLLALVHFVAFVSFWVQLEGLVGAHGIAPASHYFEAIHRQLGASAYLQLPSLCWVFGAGKFLHVLCAGGVALSLLLFIASRRRCARCCFGRAIFRSAPQGSFSSASSGTRCFWKRRCSPSSSRRGHGVRFGDSRNPLLCRGCWSGGCFSASCFSPGS